MISDGGQIKGKGARANRGAPFQGEKKEEEKKREEKQQRTAH